MKKDEDYPTVLGLRPLFLKNNIFPVFLINDNEFSKADEYSDWETGIAPLGYTLPLG